MKATGVPQLRLGKRTCQEALQAVHYSPSLNHDSKYKAVLNGNVLGKYKQERFHSACSILSHHH